MGLQITVFMYSWGKLWTKDTKTKKKKEKAGDQEQRQRTVHALCR